MSMPFWNPFENFIESNATFTIERQIICGYIFRIIPMDEKKPHARKHMGQYHRSEVLREALSRKTATVLFLESESLFSVDKSRVLFHSAPEIVKYY
jgi:hypothetical protein